MRRNRKEPTFVYLLSVVIVEVEVVEICIKFAFTVLSVRCLLLLTLLLRKVY